MTSLAEIVYRLGLWLLPAEFRGRFGAEMCEDFRQLARRAHRRGAGPLAALTAAALADLVRTAFVERRASPAPVLKNRLISGADPGSGPRLGLSATRNSATMIDSLLQDLRHAVRLLVKNPGFTAVAVLTLALGIGANTAIFSVVRGVLLEPLDFHRPDRLVTLWHHDLESGELGSVSPGNFYDWRQQASSIESMAAFYRGNVNLAHKGEPLRAEVVIATGDLFEVLGVPPLLGRTFSGHDDLPGGERRVVLSHQLWQRLFGGDRDVVGQALTINGNPAEILGVMPPEFRFPNAAADLWLPARFSTEFRADRTEYWLRVVARLAPGFGVREANAEFEPIAVGQRQAFPQANNDVGVAVVLLSEILVEDVEESLLFLMGAVVFVLLIACVNLSHLMLARAAGRRRELAVRRALGSSRARLLRQLLTESLLLAVVGGLAGLGLAYPMLEAVLALVPGDLPQIEAIAIDGPVIALCLGVALVAGLVVGAAPALGWRRGGVALVLHAGGRGGRRRGRGMNLLVVTEVALSVVLLIAAGLLLRTLFSLQGVDPGFRTENLLTFELSRPASSDHDEETSASFFERLVTEIETLPGVRSAAVLGSLPVGGRSNAAWLNFVDRPPLAAESTPPIVGFEVVGLGLFETLGGELARGRLPVAKDGPEAPVVLINEAAERQFWDAEGAIGRRITLGPDGGWIPPSTVVGVVRDLGTGELGRPVEPMVYMPHRLVARWGSMVVAVRTEVEPMSLVPQVRARLAEIDPRLPIFAARTMDEAVASTLAPTRSVAVLLAVFAGVALVLAAVGVFGALSFSVSQRRREMGIRLAIGADVGKLRREVVGQGLRQALLGIALGLLGALALERFVASLLYGVGATDPATFAVAAGTLLGVALVASWVPALRASRVEPVEVLRAE